MNSSCGSCGALPSGSMPNRCLTISASLAEQRIDLGGASRRRRRPRSCGPALRVARCRRPRRNRSRRPDRSSRASRKRACPRRRPRRTESCPETCAAFEKREHELRLVVEHLLEVRHAPFARRPNSDGSRRRCDRACRRAPSPAACAATISARRVVAGARVLAQQEQQLGRPRKFRRVAEAAVARDRTPR